FVALLCAVFGAVLWCNRVPAREFLGSNALEVILCTCAGGVGALVSTIIRVRDVNLNASSGPVLHYFEGSARVVVGFTGAFLVALAIKANLFLGLANVTSSETIRFATIAAVCFVAGASERVVPSLIKQIETNSVSDDEPPKASRDGRVG